MLYQLSESYIYAQYLNQVETIILYRFKYEDGVVHELPHCHRQRERIHQSWFLRRGKTQSHFPLYVYLDKLSVGRPKYKVVIPTSNQSDVYLGETIEG